MRRSKHWERGSVFILTLAVLAGLVAIVTGLAVTNREATHAERNRMGERRARLAAESAIQRAIALLQAQDPSRATSTDPWVTYGDGGATQYTLGQDAYRISIIDSCSRININTVDQAQLKKLALTDNQIDSLLDWRGPEKTPRANGAKDEYYNSLSTGYNAKLLPFDRTDELLLVKDFTPTALYGPASNGSSANPNSGTGSAASLGQADSVILDDVLTVESISADMNPTGGPKLNINAATFDQLVAIGVSPQVAGAVLQARNASFPNFGAVFTIPGMDNFSAKAIADNCALAQTATHTGLINVNTASEAVLNTIPNLTPDVVSGIISRRDTGLHSLGDLVDVPGMTMLILSQTIDRLCVGSRSFCVRALGVAGTSRVALEADLAIGDDGQVRIRRMKTEPYPMVRSRWNWPDTPTKTVTAVGS